VAETDRNDLEALAGEYVLGTLPDDERRAAEARLSSDGDFRREVAAWEARLEPLADTAPAVTPPADLFDRILRSVEASAPAPGGNVVVLRRSLTRWRMATALVGAAAAALAGIVVIDRMQPAPQTEFVAVLTTQGEKPAFVASVDVAKGTISVRRVADAAPADKSYELWAIEPNQAPKSLGVVEQVNLSRPMAVAPANVTLAISLEPKGGSPTGAPTGPVVYTGALVATE
jgi:anti-sigma-K factor RskA